MVALVERMLELNKRRGGLGPPATGKQTGARRAPLPTELDRVEREIASTDAEIDDLVYELYGITDEEQRIIEAPQGRENVAQRVSAGNESGNR